MDDALGEGLEDGVGGLVVDRSGLGVEVLHIISHLDGSLGTRLNSVMSKMAKEGPTILPKAKAKDSFALPLS